MENSPVIKADWKGGLWAAVEQEMIGSAPLLVAGTGRLEPEGGGRDAGNCIGGAENVIGRGTSWIELDSVDETSNGVDEGTLVTADRDGGAHDPYLGSPLKGQIDGPSMGRHSMSWQ